MPSNERRDAVELPEDHGSVELPFAAKESASADGRGIELGRAACVAPATKPAASASRIRSGSTSPGAPP